MNMLMSILEEIAGIKEEKVADISAVASYRIKRSHDELELAVKNEDAEGVEKAEAKIESAWQNIYDETGIDPNGVYTVNVSENVVYEKVFPERLAEMLLEGDAVPKGTVLKTYQDQ